MNSESDNQTIPWVEKYRPTQFDHIVLDSTNKQLFKQILHKGYFPNFCIPNLASSFFTTFVNLGANIGNFKRI